MLALIASRIPGPVEETSDRDPGFLTLAFSVARILRRGARTAYRRHVALIAAAGRPFPL
ncbi:hypothetical protein Q8W71_23175 [Methylobacterium sp. NEAU 140]|uniref:hypothetical protein n=1 Tax=Methylobacterium sp. NEAU 140 TaxID=3064945 RepID=UPI002736A212|nr:hypothetical protein [Methylobacterium sp. NEAU 140]MDP4025541.1 hypothetical protein [Methylobacterium sp. NEAU 140]